MSLFPVGKTMRANLFVYREIDDPWLQRMRRAPEETLNVTLPQARAASPASSAIDGDIKIRPADLSVSARVICSPASCWSATPSRPPAR